MELAIADMTALRKTGTRINLGSWINRDKQDNICSVCFGGAVLARHFSGDIKKQFDADYTLDPTEIGLSKKDQYILNSLDSARNGNIRFALDYFYAAQTGASFGSTECIELFPRKAASIQLLQDNSTNYFGIEGSTFEFGDFKSHMISVKNELKKLNL